MSRSMMQPLARIVAKKQRALAALVCACAVGLPGLAAAQNDFIVLSPSRVETDRDQIASQAGPSGAEVHRLLDCIFREMELGYQLAPMPARRAEIMFDNGIASAIIDTYQGQLPDLPSYAAPIMPQQWAWFFGTGTSLHPQEASFADDARIAVPGQYGLQEHMLELGFRTVSEASNMVQLVQLLQHGRVNAVLAPSAQFREASQMLGLVEGTFRSEAQATWHLVVRFRNEFATAHPDVVSGFAQARATCETQ